MAEGTSGELEACAVRPGDAVDPPGTPGRLSTLMDETRSRSVVITGASRGLGLATATHLHRQGWTVLAAMRTPDAGLQRLKENLGPAHDPSRLIGHPPRSRGSRLDRVRSRPDPRHGGRARRTRAQRGARRRRCGRGDAGSGGASRCSPPTCSDRSASPRAYSRHAGGRSGPDRRRLQPGRRFGACRRPAPTRPARARSSGGPSRWRWRSLRSVWGSPFSSPVPSRPTSSSSPRVGRTPEGPYVPLHEALEAAGETMRRFARPPDRFAPAVERALLDRRPFCRHPVGIDAALLLYGVGCCRTGPCRS